MKIKRKLSMQLSRVRNTDPDLIRSHRPAKGERPGRKPKISRMVALGIKFDEMLRRGEVESATELARLNHVSQPRMAQILSMALLAPDIQEALLCLPRKERGRAELHEKLMRPIAGELDWDKQREMWRELVGKLKMEVPLLDDAAEPDNSIVE
ncbi:hypothetical protein SH139x_002007 [Planctomycetaceae bacterium SH139]